jgi:hypothetical protein
VADERNAMPPSQFLAFLREFLRSFATLVQAFPVIQRGTWESFLRLSGGGIRDHPLFMKALREPLLADPAGPRRVGEVALEAMKLVRVVSRFPEGILQGGNGEEIRPDSLDYKGVVYRKLAYDSIEYTVDRGYHLLRVRGLRPPPAGGTLLLWLYLPDTDLRQRAGTLKIGMQPGYTFMLRQIVDVETYQREKAAILTLPLTSGGTMDELCIQSPMQDTDLRSVSVSSDEHVRVYHKP